MALTTINQTIQLQLHVCILKPVMFICNYLAKWSSCLENSKLRSSIVHITNLLFLVWLQTHTSLFVIGFTNLFCGDFVFSYEICVVSGIRMLLRLPRRDDINLPRYFIVSVQKWVQSVSIPSLLHTASNIRGIANVNLLWALLLQGVEVLAMNIIYKKMPLFWNSSKI